MDGAQSQAPDRVTVLGWVKMRSDGWLAEHIAVLCEVDDRTVRTALEPFEPVTQQRQLPILASLVNHAPAWIRARRQGVRMSVLARQAGVREGRVRLATQPFGPYPPAVDPVDPLVQQWVRKRRDGLSVREIAAGDGVPQSRVSARTQAHGPFARPTGLPAGFVGANGIGRLAGASPPAVSCWTRQEEFPTPAGVGPIGQPLWAAVDVQAWITANLHPCPECDARVRSVSHHRRVAHRQ